MKNKLFLSVTASVLLFACNNSKNENSTTGNERVKSAATDQTATNKPESMATVSTPTKIVVEGKEINLGGSLLVQKDKYKLRPGNDYMVLLTAPSSAGHEIFVLNFLMALKTGTYPIVGMSYNRGQSPHNEMYGGILGGEPKLTNYKVNITECKDLGSNNMGGHRWSISGEFSELTIAAMGIMLMDKTKNHPKEIKIEKGSFSNLTFDDNWEEMLKGATAKMKNK